MRPMRCPRHSPAPGPCRSLAPCDLGSREDTPCPAVSRTPQTSVVARATGCEAAMASEHDRDITPSAAGLVVSAERWDPI